MKVYILIFDGKPMKHCYTSLEALVQDKQLFPIPCAETLRRHLRCRPEYNKGALRVIPLEVITITGRGRKKR